MTVHAGEHQMGLAGGWTRYQSVARSSSARPTCRAGPLKFSGPYVAQPPTCPSANYLTRAISAETAASSCSSLPLLMAS